MISLSTALLLGNIGKNSAAVLSLMLGDAPLDHIKEIFEALSAGGEAADKLRTPEMPTLRKALEATKQGLEEAYEASFRKTPTGGFREDVETAFANLDEIFQTCLPGGADLIHLRYDPAAIGNFIADAAVAHDLEVFRNGEPRRLLITLVVLSFDKLDKNPAFMAVLTRVNWGEAFRQLGRIETWVEEIDQGVKALATDTREILQLLQSAGVLQRGAEGGIPEAAIRAIVERLGGQDLSRKDLVHWLNTWIEAAERELSRPTNGGEVFEITRREAEQRFRQGRLKEASFAFMEELEREQKRQEEHLAESKRLSLRLLEEAVRFDELAFDGEAAVTKLRKIAELEGIVNGDALGVWLTNRAEQFYKRGRDKGQNAALLIAVSTLRAALEERPRDRVPLDWAKTMSIVGVVLMVFGYRESGTARLEEAVAAHRAAL